MLSRRPALIALVAGAAATTLSCNASRRSQAARDAIHAASTHFAEALSRGDTVAVARSYTDDAEWYAPEVPVVRGGPEIARAWRQVGAAGSRHQVDVSEVVESSDRAQEIGRFTVSAADGSVIAAAKYMVVWVRASDGEWKRNRDFFNWDIPPRGP
jgi:ketosteroid isomerase-like protein